MERHEQHATASAIPNSQKYYKKTELAVIREIRKYLAAVLATDQDKEAKIGRAHV